MKYHSNLLHAIASILQENFSTTLNADKIIQRVLKENKKWGARDRKFIAETSYDLIRWWRLLWEIAGESPSLESEKLLSLIGIQLFLSEEDDTLLNKYSTLNGNQIAAKYKSLKSNRAIRESIPDWLDELCYNELGESWEKELRAMNEQARVVLRVNELKITSDELSAKLLEMQIETEKVTDISSALILRTRQNIFQNEFFKNGFFEIQDVNSQQVAMMMKLNSGIRIVDACAGGGGKSLHIASMLKNSGKVIALDTNEKKLFQLKQRARRNGISIIETRVIDNSKIIKRLKDSADRLLLDVPCSGLGVLRRNPDVKWKLSKEKIFELIETQKNILNRYSSIVKPGGYLIYSTCSILPSENEKQIETFVSTHPNFEIDEIKNLSPHLTGFDGFFIARLIRKN